MKVYLYNPVTGEYLKTRTAQKSPLEKNVYLLPANATFTAPLKTKKNQSVVFKNKNWSIVSDFRGAVYYDKITKNISIINELGVIPENLTKEKPGKFDKWSGSAWIVNTNKKQELIKEIAAEIDGKTANALAAGVDFDNNNFPLIGDSYTCNISAASAYMILQGTDGREFLTSAGAYVHVSDIAGLVAAGDTIVTNLIKAGVDEKTALQAKTTAELIDLLNR